MERSEAANRILLIIETVEESGPFTGRANLLTTLKKFQDLIILYKQSSNIYEIILKEAEKLVETTRGKLSENEKGGK